MSILSGKKIIEQVELGNIEIDPFNPEHVNPASVDLTLGSTYKKFFNALHPPEDLRLDAKVENKMLEFEMGEHGLWLLPNHFYLLHTVERVCAKTFVPVLDGKSSIGRLTVLIHFTAGFGDPGFDGQYTLEVMCVHPTLIYAGMRIAQMRFHTIEGEVEDYKERGNYVGERATGPVESQSWRQFKARDEDCFLCKGSMVIDHKLGGRMECPDPDNVHEKVRRQR